MHAGTQAFRRLGVDIALPHDAAKSCLNVPARTAEPIVKLQMPESGVEIVTPQEIYHPAAKPHAFWIGRWACEYTRGFCKVVGFFGGIFWSVAALRLCRFRVRGLLLTALG